MENNMFSGDHSRNDKMPMSKENSTRVEQKQRGKHTPIAAEVAIDWDQAKKLCGMFCNQREIAAFFDVSRNTLAIRVVTDGIAGNWSEFHEMHQGKGRINLRHAQYQKAMDGNTHMLIWLGKQVLNQTDKNVIIHDDVDDTTRKDYNLDKVNTNDLETLKSILSKAHGDE